jgi:hypothetical protein
MNGLGFALFLSNPINLILQKIKCRLKENHFLESAIYHSKAILNYSSPQLTNFAALIHQCRFVQLHATYY